MDRRHFLKIVLTAMGGLVAFILGLPLIASIFEPFYQKKHEAFIRVPGFPAMPENKMANLTFSFPAEDSFFKQDQTQEVWVIKHAADRVTVFSPICPHLSCRVNWQADWQRFACPCHGSVFNADGQMVSGPAPRSLDTLPYKIEDGELYVQWKYFKAGIAQKVEIG